MRMTDRYRRFGDFQRILTAGRNELSLNVFNPKLEWDAEGNLIPCPPPRIKLNAAEVLRLFRPYVSVRFMEQVKAVVPLALYLALFQILFLRQLVEDSWVITGGLFAVIAGLMFFMEGLKLGLMPFGAVIGNQLPRKSPLPLVLFITLLLGIGVTFAEPAISALKAAGCSAGELVRAGFAVSALRAAGFDEAALGAWTYHGGATKAAEARVKCLGAAMGTLRQSRDGATLVGVGSAASDKEVTLFKASDLNVLRTLGGHESPVMSVRTPASSP